MCIPLFIFCCFSLAAFNICSLCLIFVNLINMCLGVFFLGFILFGTLGFLDLGDYFLPHFKEVFNYYLFKYFLMVFLFVFFFWDPYDSNVVAFNIVLEVSEIVLISFNLFFFFPPGLFLISETYAIIENTTIQIKIIIYGQMKVVFSSIQRNL